jgi:hypothetical protein
MESGLTAMKVGLPTGPQRWFFKRNDEQLGSQRSRKWTHDASLKDLFS